MGRAYLKIVDVPARGAGQRKASSGPLPFGVSVPEQRHFASSRALQRPDRPGVSRMTMAPTWVSSWPRTGRAVWRDEVKVAARRVVVDAPESTRRADSRERVLNQRTSRVGDSFGFARNHHFGLTGWPNTPTSLRSERR